MPESRVLHSNISEWHANCFAAGACDINYAFVAFVNGAAGHFSFTVRFAIRLSFGFKFWFGIWFGSSAISDERWRLPDL